MATSFILISILVLFPEWISCRQVLNIMVIFGFMLNYALRVNLTIAIVDMAEDVKTTSPVTNVTALIINDTLHVDASETITALASAPNLATSTSAASLVAPQNATSSWLQQVIWAQSHFIFNFATFQIHFIYTHSFPNKITTLNILFFSYSCTAAVMKQTLNSNGTLCSRIWFWVVSSGVTFWPNCQAAVWPKWSEDIVFLATACYGRAF